MAQPPLSTLCSHDSIASSEPPKRCCTLRRRSSSPPPPSPSFSFNGKQLCPLSRDSTLEDSSAVRLVGFHKRGSLVVDPTPPSNGTNMGDTEPASAEGTGAPDPLRQDQLNALLQHTQDALRAADTFSSPSSSSPLTNPPSSEAYKRMEGKDLQRFVEEANMRCANSSHEQFVDFVRTNRQAFAQLLEETASMFNGTLRLPTPSFGDRDSGVFTDHDAWNCGAATSGGEAGTSSGATRQQFVFSSGSPSIFRVVNGGSSSETNLRTSESVSVTTSVRSSDTDPALHFNTLPLPRRADNGTTSRGLDSPDGTMERNNRTLLDMDDLLRRSPLFERTQNLFRASGMTDVMSASDTQLRAKPRPFSDFERLSDASLRSDPEGLNVRGRMSSSFHFSTRSHFEYCGETNTFRFSTQQVCESLSGSYESVSESEDEEESLEDCTSLGEEAKILAIEDVPTYLPKVDDSIDTISTSSLSLGTPSITSSKRLEKPTTGVAASSWGKVAQELLSTEKTYVEVLHLLDQVFAFRVDQENRAHSMFPQAVVSAMFSNLKSLYQLHHDFLLPKLQDRIDTWDSNPRIGDIMKDFAPFLKMYTEYVRNYDDAMRLLGSWYNKQPRFQSIMDDIHRMPECGNLTIQHHMLTPVQRVPRYQLLLKEYLKKLPEDSPDKIDTEKALELVSTAAIHSNEAMKKIDKFKKLLEIQDLIGGVMDLVSPTRELLREGKITKICARSGDQQERHMFVFNDLVLLCSQRLMSNRVVSGACYRIRARVDVDGLIVQEGDNLETPNSFYIKNTGRSIELFAQSPEEKMSWMQTLAKAVHDLKMRKSSLRVGLNGSKSPEDLELGQRAPVLVKADTVSHCQKCSMAFSALGLRWKHHCHACGIVACSKCLSRKAKLAYDNNRASRVCTSCWAAILKNHPDKADAEREIKSPLDSPTFQVENAVISGYLKLKTGGQDRSSKAWARRWFALHPDFVLYSFKSHEDFLPLTSMPVPGFLVSVAEKGDGVDLRLPIFKLFHQKKTYLFQASDIEELERWTKALEKASRAEDPG